VRAPRVLAACVEDEVVALDVERGVCFGLDGVGSRIWRLLEAPNTARSLCEVLVGIYEVDPETCEREVLGLLQDLADEGLVVEALSGGANSALAPPEP
jgi:Coenzyme PQQ synthesis protein D (PqqD)